MEQNLEFGQHLEQLLHSYPVPNHQASIHQDVCSIVEQATISHVRHDFLVSCNYIVILE